jgi:hypothetical protein
VMCSPLIAHDLCCICSLRRLKCHGESLSRTSLDLRTPDAVALTSKSLTVSKQYIMLKWYVISHQLVPQAQVH